MSNWESAQVLLASASQSATGQGAAVDLGTRDRLLRQTLNITATSSPAPTLTVKLEASADGVAAWKPFATYATVNSVAFERISAVAPERYARVSWLLSGAGATATFAVTGTRGISFASNEHLENLGLAAAALASVTPSKRAEALAAATVLASSILGARYTLPIVAWDIDLAQAVCKIVAYDILSIRGFNPESDADKNVRDRHDDAMAWLRSVARGETTPVGLVDSTPDEEEGGVEYVTHEARAWRRR